MALPKVQHPQYHTTLPVSKAECSYRPYTAKEEKILLMAASSGKPEDIINAVKQIARNCSDLDPDDCHPVDIEYLFVRLRAVSSSNVIEVLFRPSNCDREDCPDTLSGFGNLDEVYATEFDTDVLEESGIKESKRAGHWIIPVNDEIGLEIKLKDSASTDDVEVLYECVQTIYDGEDVHVKGEDFDLAEFREFYETIPIDALGKVTQFFNATPKLQCELSGRCQKCSQDFNYTVQGLADFFG